MRRNYNGRGGGGIDGTGGTAADTSQVTPDVGINNYVIDTILNITSYIKDVIDTIFCRNKNIIRRANR